MNAAKVRELLPPIRVVILCVGPVFRGHFSLGMKITHWIVRVVFGAMLGAFAVSAAVAQKLDTPVPIKVQGSRVLRMISVGDPAPELKVERWISGAPVSEFESGDVYVVNFVASWCGTCRTTIPTITGLAKKFAKDARFLAVFVYEGDTKTDQEDIALRAKSIFGAEEPAFPVALDTAESDSASAWLTAAGQSGVPVSYIVNRDGKIAWIGMPSQAAPVLSKVVSGTWNIHDARDEYNARYGRPGTVLERTISLTIEADHQLSGLSPEQQVKTIDEIVARQPEVESSFSLAKFTALLDLNEADAYSYAEKLLSGCCKDDWRRLNNIAWMIVMECRSDLKKPNDKLALEIAQRSAELAKGNELAQVLSYDTLALAHFRLGQVQKAVDVQQNALKIAQLLRASIDEQTLVEMRQRLKEYEAASSKY